MTKKAFPLPFQDVILEEGMTWTAHMIGYSRIDVHIAEKATFVTSSWIYAYNLLPLFCVMHP